MTSCFPFFSSKKSRKEKKPTQQDIDDIPAVIPTGTPVVNLEAEKLQEQQQKENEEVNQDNQNEPQQVVQTEDLPSTSNQSAIPQEEPEVTTHVHTHEVVTIKEFIPQSNTQSEKELAAELKAAQAELKCAQLKLQVLQDENVDLLEKNLGYTELKKKEEEKEKEVKDLMNEINKLKDQIDKSKDEVKNYQNHINTAGKKHNY